MQCVLNLAVDVLQKHIAYKYYVRSSHLNDKDDGFEDLQEAAKYGKIVNRCLLVPETARKKGGKFKDFCCCCFPPPPFKGTILGFYRARPVL